MCLTSKSLDQWIKHNQNYKGIPVEDMKIASELYRALWTTLDHTKRHYCVNPLILAAEKLEFVGVGWYPEIPRFQGDKGQRYKETMAHFLTKDLLDIYQGRTSLPNASS